MGDILDKQQKDFGRIQKMAMAFQQSRILLTAYELGVFTALDDGPLTAGDVAGRIMADVRATDRLLAALTALDLLIKEGDRYENTPAASEFLVEDRPGFMSGLMHAVHLWDSWSTLTAAVRQGESVVARPVNDRGERWLTAFIRAMHWRAVKQAENVVDLLRVEVDEKVLDVGGGSGAYAMAFANRAPGVTATVFDLPNVVPLTRGYVEEAELSDRVGTAVGDYLTDELGSGYDTGFLSAIIHSNTPEQNRELFAKVYRALNPGGRIVVQDFIMDPDRTSPAFGAVFALNMLVGTHGGDTYTDAQVRGWMSDVGFTDMESMDTGVGTTLIIGKKPA
ncbi:MAG: methyltransferase [Desulfatibacillaceae bacterium]